MRRFRLRFVTFLVLLVAVAGLIGRLWLEPTSAQDAGLTFRLSRIESENARLRARVNQLETQVNRLDRVTGGVTAPAASPPPVADLEGSAFAGDPMFDRLATLVIETRQDVLAVQDRLTDLEDRLDEWDNSSLNFSPRASETDSS